MARTGLVLTCALVGLMMSGCMHSPDVVRSQGPDQHSYAMTPGMMPQPGHHGHMHGQQSQCPTCPPGHNMYGMDFWKPTHHHTWEYNAPQGLRYPDPNQPPAVIQYPYYTVKGPTDYFYTGE